MMSLFNWEGAAIFGPGSEWFWAMAQFVVVVITLAGIYRQLRAQASANAFHQMATLNDRWNSDHLVRARLALVLHYRYEEAGAGIPSLMRPMCDFFEDIAFLQERGHLSQGEVWANWNRTIEFWWTLLAPAILETRRLYPGDYESFERLNALMRKLDLTHGRVNEFDPVTISKILDDSVRTLTAALVLDQESKAGTIPTAPAAAV